MVKIFSGDWLMRANDAPIWLKLDINFDQGWLLLLGFSGKHSWWWWQKTWEWFLFLVSRIPFLSPFKRHDDLLKLHDSLPAWQSWETLQRCGNASWRLVYVHRRWVQLHITVATSAFFEKSVAEKDGTLVAVSTGDNKKRNESDACIAKRDDDAANHRFRFHDECSSIRRVRHHGGKTLVSNRYDMMPSLAVGHHHVQGSVQTGYNLGLP